jgi:RPA family protein
MSASGREVAHRIFAAEYDDATYAYSESDEERAPNYVVTPTGARVNRVFFVGVLTEVESVSDDVLRARIADPTGVFVVYAGQYQPDEMAFLEEADPPTFVAVTGKARTFSPDDSDRVFTSVRPESINEVDAETRDRWAVQAAEGTLARVATARAAMDLDLSGDPLTAALRESGAPEDLADGIPRAFAEYGTTEQYLAAVSHLAVDALELVADEADEVPGLTVAPDDAGDDTVDPAALADGVEGGVVELQPRGSAVEPGEEEPAEETGPATEADTASTDAEDEASGQPGADAPEDPGAAVDDFGDIDDSDTEDGTATSAGATDDDLGGFEPDGDADEDAEPDDADEDDDVPAEDVLDDEERERLEEEYGTFESGKRVGEPGEADIEPEAGPIEPEDGPGGRAESASEERADTEDAASGSGADAEPEPEEPAGAEAEETGEEPGADGDEASGDDAAEAAEAAEETTEPDAVDVEDAVMEWMADLDEGDGADRETLVAAVVDEHGVDPGTVEDAIQDALMAGKCYEPDDAHVKPI